MQVFSCGSMDVWFNRQSLLAGCSGQAEQIALWLCGRASRVQDFELREVRTAGRGCNKVVSFTDQEQRTALTHATACALGLELSCLPAR